MALPTDGYAPTSVTYMIGTGNNLTVTVTVGANTATQREAAEEFLPYLETALAALRDDYQNGTQQTVLYIERTYSGDMRGSI
ncbi:hypothetical protein ABTY20_18845 [Streptomyces sp. NPDC126497]|uniref:hypothetical protein n=1 Tax=Streptomyces sp. NPDC126497 TaxID=3155313 RepID=UPI00333064CA